MSLKELMKWSFGVLDSLPKDDQYKIAFSGGKDSHVLLGVYLQWLIQNPPLNLKVVFADTQLEAPKLYKLVTNAKKVCEELEVEFITVKPPLERNYWVLQFGRGYCVPRYNARWCTSKLKIRPIKRIKGKDLTGSHLGESPNRDKRLNGCGSTECGIDLLEGRIEPIARWGNCDVWDWIGLFGDGTFYDGFCNDIHDTYEISDSEGSLRFGCVMCPVVSLNTIKKNVSSGAVPPVSSLVRNLLEELRGEPRINNPRTGKAGAILVDSRIKYWEKMETFFPELLNYQLISPEIIARVNQLLSDRAYPITYPQEWIEEQERLVKIA